MSLPRPCLPIHQRRRKRALASEAESENETPMEISSLETMNAMEYLAFVQRQSDSLPDVFVSPAPNENEIIQNHESIINDAQGSTSVAIDGSAAARDYLFSHRLDILPPPSAAHAPAADHLSSWKDSTLNSFSTLRLYLSTCCKELKTKSTTQQRVKVPKSKDVYAWHIFCLGEQGRAEMESRMIDVQMSGLDYNATAAEIDMELSQYNIPSGGYEPTTKLMSQFDQIIFRRLLSHHTEYISAGCTITMDRMKWIYAVLARLEKPIHRDEACILTELLRGLCRARAKVKLGSDPHREDDIRISECIETEQVLKAINVAILIIGVYFEQCTNEKRLLAAAH